MNESGEGVGFFPNSWQRAWLALGFQWGPYAGRPEDEAAFYVIHDVVTHWDWRDRLRILVSGKTSLQICMEIESPPITFLDGAATTSGPPIVGKTRVGHVVLVPGK